MSLVTAALAGAAVAVRHSIEPDHLAAVSTLVESDNDRPAGVGASWGVGHSLVVLLAGLAFLLTGVQVPGPVAGVFEALAGLALVYLGFRALRVVLGHRETKHTHKGDGLHTHVSVAGLDLGTTHTHVHGESVFVGVLHGFAGGGALVLLLAAAAPTPLQGALYLGVFAGTTVLVMAALSHAWGRLLNSELDRYVRGMAGAVSLVVGASIAAETLAIL